jgi:hypothetical protein
MSLFITLVIYDITNSKIGAITGGVGLISFQPLLTLWAMGPYPQYFACVFILSGLYVSGRKRPALATAIGTVAVSMWQFSIGYFFAIFIVNFGNHMTGSISKADFIRSIIAVPAVSLVIFLPYILTGSFQEMIIQSVFANIIQYYPTLKSQVLINQFEFGKWFVYVGLSGVGLMMYHLINNVYIYI